MPHHEGFRHLEHRIDTIQPRKLNRVKTNRLLDQNMLPGIGRLSRPLDMQMIGKRNVHRDNLRIGKYGVSSPGITNIDRNDAIHQISTIRLVPKCRRA